ncbi:hypothetical protein [Nocardiopsis aegyptia]|uniref:Prepilin signal peptidase PulO-like enzyme (Type II secretory pathway) n=1 Tax=Nocardiopsis aegyptia TaxID=220378 RepID=A0A7Z0JBK3_9ACTN|nr:hypothetical protein [Nocardiopsis aegyptia]NYJ35524.1 prepilin signal peptidase PulO-like enzyme (type II secretory pathway) [Nocardiopsis aegyptia]
MTIRDLIAPVIDEFRPSRLRDEFEDVNRINAENPRLRARWAARSRRRVGAALMGVFVLTGAVLLGLLTFRDGDGPFLLVLAFLTSTGGYLYLFTQLNRAMRTGLRYQSLDERQRVERDHATRVGHHTTGVLLMAVFLLLAAASILPPEVLHLPNELMMPLVWLALMVHSSTPCAYLAWTRPDDIPDDEDDVPAA